MRGAAIAMIAATARIEARRSAVGIDVRTLLSLAHDH
jgi:hypothetical protein